MTTEARTCLSTQTSPEQPLAAAAVHHVFHVFVEVSKTDHREVTFDRDQVTGAEIKIAANVPLDSDLAIREPGKIEELVTNEERVTIKDGEHFVSLPAGTIS